MKSRYWNRRESDVAPNGYFTVLKSSGSVSAVRLPAGFRYLVKGAPYPSSRFPLNPESEASGLPPQILPTTSKEPYLKRLLLALVGGVAVTGAFLWCLFQA